MNQDQNFQSSTATSDRQWAPELGTARPGPRIPGSSGRTGMGRQGPPSTGRESFCSDVVGELPVDSVQCWDVPMLCSRAGLDRWAASRFSLYARRLDSPTLPGAHLAVHQAPETQAFVVLPRHCSKVDGNTGRARFLSFGPVSALDWAGRQRRQMRASRPFVPD